MVQAIEFTRLGKRFGATQALRDVSFDCRAGDVVAIAGENGAGKSTLIKILSGVIPAGDYEGSVAIDGRAVRFANVRDAEREGVFLVPQELHVVPELRVADFLFLNREPSRFGVVDERVLLASAARWLSTFKLAVSPLTPMGRLGPHEQQLVSIARAMTQGVRILILDEPTASLTGRETDILFERVRAFRDEGVTTLYVSHRLAEFERIADAVTVMRDGTVVDQFRPDRSERIPERVVRAMVGRDLDELYPRRVAPIGAPVLALEDWTVTAPGPGRRRHVAGVSLTLHAGEVVGVFGLIGSGASELARSMFGGADPGVSGHARMHGRLIRLRDPRRAMRAGLAYLPADRKRDGLVLGLSISQNLTLAALDRFAYGGLVRRRRELAAARDAVRALRVRCTSTEQPIGDLSGGNQQKIAAAKWGLGVPEVVILEEPTRGVDVGARLEIYALINDMAEAGKAVLLVSTDLPEVLGMSDRVLAMHEGRLTGSWPRGTVDEREVMLSAAGSSREMSA